MLDFLLVMDTPASRLESLMVEDKINTQQELADKLDYDVSSISKYLKPDGKLSPKFLQKVEDTLGWSTRWIRFGTAPKRVHHKPENQLGENQESHSPYNAQARDNGGRNNMWVIPAKAQAGFARNFERRMFSYQIEKVNFPMIQGECFCFEIEGFSMYPDYTPGNFVISTTIEDRTWLRKGKVYVFQTLEGIVIKIFEGIVDDTVYLSSINPTHNPVDPIPLTELRAFYNIEFKVERPHS